MKLIDEVEIEVTAGHGGSGCKHFRREKFVPLGGPDGGNGGHGGSIIAIADKNINTLLDFRHRPNWNATDGEPGEGSRRDGKSGQDLIIRVPIGTEIIDINSTSLLCDLAVDGQKFTLAKGGRGGKGNDFFKSPTNRTPEQFQPGEPGEHRYIRLSLKLVADVAIIGFPNAGKSTLISRISAAKPKIADYPFTTLEPNLGVVRANNSQSFVVADIPGLISGAHLGKGLGIRFLKHIERTKVLIHLIDISYATTNSDISPVVNSYSEIINELAAFDEKMTKKPQIVAISKVDTLPTLDALKDIIQYFTEKNIKCIPISSVSGNGLKELVNETASLLNSIE